MKVLNAATIVALACLALASSAAAAESTIAELVVKLRAAPEGAMSADTRQKLGMALGLGFNDSGRSRDGAFRLQLTPAQSIDEARAALNRVRLDPDVLYASIAASPLPNTAAPAEFALPTDRLIVKYRDSVVTTNGVGSGSLAQARLSRLSAVAGLPLVFVRSMHDDSSVLYLGRRTSLATVEAIAARIAAEPEVEFAQPDYIRKINLMPSDPCFPTQSLPACSSGYQWDLFEAAGGINAPAAWDITKGSVSIVIGVLDTGALFNHPDLASRFIPGYDMVNDALLANDNDPAPMCPETTPSGCFGSRDGNAADPGDWLTQAEVENPNNWFFGCDYFGSSFHGSHVAGTIGAAANNGVGTVGINWVSRIQPTRILGRCGGYTSDIADGMVWASGGSVPAAPANPTPVRVMNLSIGGFSSNKTCSAVEQNAINSALSRNVVVVVSAGNENFDAAFASPANCAGVITVAATGQRGFKSFYSNFGPLVEVAAPGGDSRLDTVFNPNRLLILSSLNAGVQIPISSNPPTTGAGPPDPNGYNFVQYQGTSMSAPHVTGVVSLMLSVNPNLTPAQVASKLQSTTRAFPTGAPACNLSNDPISNPLPVAQWKLCTCTTALCGTGIIDAAAAVSASFASVLDTAVVSVNPYGTLTVAGAIQNGNTISNFQPSAVIQLGNVAGAAGSFAQINVSGLSIGPNNILTIRSGAAGQSVLLINSDATPSAIAGSIVAVGGNGAPAPMLTIRNANGITVYPTGSVTAPNGLSLSGLGATPLAGQGLTILGTINGGTSTQLRGASITGGGTIVGDNVLLSTFGNANNPVNGLHFLANSLQLSPSSGATVALLLNDYGTQPQVFNVQVNGNATVSMPSVVAAGLQPNNLTVLPGQSRPAGQPAPTYGGGSMIVQALGTMKLVGGTSNDFVFPGAIVLKAGTSLDLNAVIVDQGWTTSGQAFQGIFFESPIIKSSLPGMAVYGNNLNWINFSTLPQSPVQTFTLAANGGGAAFVPADAFAPHMNVYSAVTEAAANGQCWQCLINSTPIVVYP